MYLLCLTVLMFGVAHGGDAGADPPPGGWEPPRSHITKKKVRGRTANNNLREKFEANGRRPLPIRFDENDQHTWSPLGDVGAMFTSMLGTLVNDDHFPRHYESWRHVPDSNKAIIWPSIETYFDLGPYMDGGSREAGLRAAIDAICGHMYRDAKYTWKQKYFKARNGYEDPNHLRDDPPPGVPSANWKNFVDFVTNEKNMSRSRKNAENRTKQTFTTKQGRRSFAGWRDRQAQMEPEHPPSLIDDWWNMHSGTHEADALHREMVGLRTQSPEMSEEEVLETVLGQRRGHNRGRGRQLPFSSVNPIPTSSSSSSRRSTSRSPSQSGEYVRREDVEAMMQQSQQSIQQSMQQTMQNTMMSWIQQMQAANPHMNVVQPPKFPSNVEDDEDSEG